MISCTAQNKQIATSRLKYPPVIIIFPNVYAPNILAGTDNTSCARNNQKKPTMPGSATSNFFTSLKPLMPAAVPASPSTIINQRSALLACKIILSSEANKKSTTNTNQSFLHSTDI